MEIRIKDIGAPEVAFFVLVHWYHQRTRTDILNIHMQELSPVAISNNKFLMTVLFLVQTGLFLGLETVIFTVRCVS